MYISTQSLNLVLTLTWLSLATATMVLAQVADEGHICTDYQASLQD